MYESFFGFVKRPFLAASTLDRYFPATSIEQTFQTTSRAIQRAEGPVAIFGGTGLGKTMCCLRIAESFRRSFEVVMLSSSQLITRRALLQSLLFELRMPYRDMSEGELRLTLMSRLQPSTENPTDGLVLVIDEAQTMSMKLLDEIRLLTNVVRNGIPRVRLVLCGTMRLEDCLSNPQMDSLNQRLAARCYLTPLSNQETSRYVIHKIELSGVEGSTVMTRDALDAIYRGSDGIPRLIDQLADQSLLLACNDRERPVSAAMVGRAWCMLQQLPNPWSEPESIAKTPAVSNPLLAPIASIQIPDDKINASEKQSPPAFSSIGFDSLRKVAAAAPNPAPAPQSNVEFGELDDELPEASPVEPRRRKGESEYVDTNLDNDNEIENSVSLPDTSTIPTKSLLDVFSGDFDEEFSIPVQSSDSYQSYSGASFGNLNYDLSSFGVANRNPSELGSLAFDEAEEFIAAESQMQADPLSHRNHSKHAPMPTFDFTETDEHVSEPAVDRYLETISNISPEQAANLERQIEEEMRDLVSGLNMSAMTIDPTSSIDPQATQPYGVDDRRHAHQGHSEVIAFSGMHDYVNQQEVERVSERVSMGDDRDLLVIEEDLESVRGGVAQSNGTQRVVLHPYAKLFTKLRNS